ncbi:MAG: SRPBCC family protein [Actinobacteria bacterium]|nr:SRPBCC family protein [Actinomycetota bacterium]
MTITEHAQARIEADPDVPLIRITRDFAATPEQLFRAHTDPDLYARWVGPNDITTRVDHWDCRTGGSWAFSNIRGDESYSFHGCFHEVSPTRLVQTFTFDDWPTGVSLQTLTLTDLGDGRTRLTAQSLVESFAERDQWLASGMDVGVNDGYAKLDSLLAEI